MSGRRRRRRRPSTKKEEEEEEEASSSSSSVNIRLSDILSSAHLVDEPIDTGYTVEEYQLSLSESSSLPYNSTKRLYLKRHALRNTFIGRHILPFGGQVKKAAIYAAAGLHPDQLESAAASMSNKSENENDQDQNVISATNAKEEEQEQEEEEETRRNPSPRFSLQSGICEWANGVCLFINVDDNTLYENKRWVFSAAAAAAASGEEKGTDTMPSRSSPQLQIVWYGQRSQTAQSAVIKRIISIASAAVPWGQEEADAAAAAAAASSSSSSAEQKPRKRVKQEQVHSEQSSSPKGSFTETIELFARREGSPYMYCGRLKLAGMDLTKRPVRLIFSLLDAGTPSIEPWVEMFQ